MWNVVAYGGPAAFAGRLNAAPEKWNGTGALEFMNDWYVECSSKSPAKLIHGKGHTNWVKNVSLILVVSSVTIS